MSVFLKRFTDPTTLVVLAYAPAGLGHLRVTKALYQGLPKGTKAILLPDTAPSVKTIHRFTSIYPFAKRIFEWSQTGWAEDVVTHTYRWLLQKDTQVIKQRLLYELKEQIEPPKTLLIVATHFGIAHQISTVKQQIEKEGRVKVFLVVQVTDDSPQKLWYVETADMISAPSKATQRSLELYGKKYQLKKSHFTTIPYPISPRLAEKLPHVEWEHKLRQADPTRQQLINISVPISGAGVGLSFASELMKELHRLEPRTRFQVTAKRTLFTLPYLTPWQRRDYVAVADSHSDRQIVELYEQNYESRPILLEITKPSEQAFKSLLEPSMRGGSILLFTQPVGRQEYDNLAFLRRHKLIPSPEEHQQLCDVLNLQTMNPSQLPYQHWRGFSLPNDPKDAARWLSRALNLRIFASMLQYKHQETDEVSSHGVRLFWKEVATLL